MKYFLLRPDILALVLVALLLVCCRAAPDPRQEIADYVEEAEKHFEAKNSGRLKKMIAAGYRDERNLSRQEITRILAGYFLRKQHVHVSVRTSSLSVAGDGLSAQLTVLAAISEEALTEGDIRLMQAEIYRLEATLNKEEDWRLVSAKLREASADDFLGAE